MVDRYEALERFSQLRKAGVLSEEEFAAEKAKLLAGQADAPAVAPISFSTPVSKTPGRGRRWWPWILGAVLIIALFVVLALFVSSRPTPAPTRTKALTRAPACDSTDARDLLTRAVAAQGGKFTSLAHAAEFSFDSARQTRTCAADLTLVGGDVQHRMFKLLPAGDGSSYRAELVGSIALPAASPAPDNATAGTDGNAAAPGDEPDEDHYQPPEPATRPIQITDDDKSFACCLTMRDVMRFFSSDGASYTINRAADVELQLDVVDPRGRWNGWTSFSLQFVDVEDESDNVVLWKIVRGDQTLASSDNPPGPSNPNTLLRNSFDLHTTSSDDR